MSDRDPTPTSNDQGDDDRGLPFFWGLLLIAAVTVIAVWLFAAVEFDGGSPSTTGALPSRTVYL